MTPRQADYLRAIATATAALGYAPSYAEVASEAESSVTSAVCAVRRLRDLGLVVYGGPRTIRLTDAGRAALAAEEAAE